MLFWGSQIGERRNLAKIIVLRENISKNSIQEKGRYCTWILWPQPELWLEAWESKLAERKFSLGSGTGNFMSKGKWTKKIHTKPLIILLHGLKLHAVQCFAWCPLMGKGNQNASRDTLLNISSIRKSPSFIHFWHLYCIITLVYCYWFGFRSKLYCFLTDFLKKTHKNECNIIFRY